MLNHPNVNVVHLGSLPEMYNEREKKKTHTRKKKKRKIGKMGIKESRKQKRKNGVLISNVKKFNLEVRKSFSKIWLFFLDFKRETHIFHNFICTLKIKKNRKQNIQIFQNIRKKIVT